MSVIKLKKNTYWITVNWSTASCESDFFINETAMSKMAHMYMRAVLGLHEGRNICYQASGF
jgi:hypothetical protein